MEPQKPFLPYNILLLLALLSAGSLVFYNVVVREHSAVTLQYSYPAVAQETPEAELPPEYADTPSPQEQEPEAVSVEFPLDINTATVEELQMIPRIGEVMSQRIVQFRDYIGGYTDLEQLLGIKGVGEQTWQHLCTYLIISEPATVQDSDEIVSAVPDESDSIGEESE